ncbi:MAG TPA: rRNA methyltransferase, partial [Chitinophagaceae bacterium]|nr:rRNA methyltransferase [Chitinophagaceae bacterium]
MKSGEALELTNGKGGLYTASIAQEDKRHCTVVIEKETIVPAPEKQISIAISLLKNASRFEWFLEKATEIGITEIIPLICTRTEHTRFRFDRMQQILVAAMLQSQQSWLPELTEPVHFKEWISKAGSGNKYIAHCLDTEKHILTGSALARDKIICIGPEGDFSPAEIDMA